MKTSIVISISDTGELSRLEEEARKASELGYQGIELNVKDPGQIDVKRVERVLSSRGLAVCSIITGKAFAVDGLSLSHFDERKRQLAIQRIKDQISFASAFSAIVLIGWMRGKWINNPQKARRLFIDSLESCGKFAEDNTVRLGIEPINRYEVDSIHTIEEGVTLVRELALCNVGLVADTFHMNIEEAESIDKSIRRCRGVLLHVHVADNNRRSPGMGHLPFRDFFRALHAIGYRGFVSVEVVPVIPNFETVARESMRLLHRTLSS
jgi:sugar phosphate isomerase/epimerase